MPPVLRVTFFVDDTDDPDGVRQDAVDHDIGKDLHEMPPRPFGERASRGRVGHYPFAGLFEAVEKAFCGLFRPFLIPEMGLHGFGSGRIGEEYLHERGCERMS